MNKKYFLSEILYKKGFFNNFYKDIHCFFHSMVVYCISLFELQRIKKLPNKINLLRLSPLTYYVDYVQTELNYNVASQII